MYKYIKNYINNQGLLFINCKDISIYRYMNNILKNKSDLTWVEKNI